jgi:molecular chaperone GrpE
MIPRESEEQDKGKPETEENLTSEPERDIEKALTETKQKAEDYLDSWKRTQADFINYKRRTEQERSEMGKYANTQLILSLLPILDDFERAFDSIAPRIEKTDWVKGIKLVERKLKTTLEMQGVSPIKAIGESFDPNLHEAVMHDKGEDGKVVQELRKGYRLYDKVIRPSHVVVGNGEPVEEPKEDRQD